MPVGQKIQRGKRALLKQLNKNQKPDPIEIKGRTIAHEFWGKSWCEHMESFSDFASRLPRGRTYARNGSVCHLQIETGKVKAFVCGSELYEINISFKPLSAKKWARIKKQCAGEIGSLLELLQGKLSQEVMQLVADAKQGLFPLPGEMNFDCDCPDWAGLCKHIAAVLYGVGHRLDSQPDLLFVLRDVDPQELVNTHFAMPEPASVAPSIAEDQLAAIFGIEIDEAMVPQSPSPQSTKSRQKKPPKPQSGKIRIRPSGASVKRLRKKLALSLEAFAEQAGVSVATVKRWEAHSGRLQLKARSLEALQQLHQRTP